MRICMNWRSVQFDWNKARAFLVTAEEGSLTAAAKALGMAQPTLGRQVAALEEELGVALFERVGRGLALTPGGLELVEHVRGMGEAASRMSLAASGKAEALEGSISITASEIYSASLLPPIVAKLRRLHPGVEVEIVPSNAAVDLRRREADIAIRHFPPKQPDLIGKKIRDDIGRFYATPAYLVELGHPQTLAELGAAYFIDFGSGTIREMIAGFAKRGLHLTRANFPVSAGNHFVHWELTKEGVGIGIMPEKLGDAEPLVERVLPDATPFEFPIWLATHRELKTSRRVRMVFDFLAEELAQR